METHRCCDFLDSLGDYVDGELSPALCAELEQHMAECERCRIVVDTLKLTVEIYHTPADAAEAPPEVRQRLFARLNLQDYLQPADPASTPAAPALALRAGDPCPHCHQGVLDYDGQLTLKCPVCGFAEGGCFT
ncbi:MAG TPA: anti-sigma factor [Anaerolineaceae bacterium]|nr:zf-HC2 domain-containing protein [Longilinea sp.]HNR46389.1 anti-sigma factor [Anaerolineaceae bacterium]HNS37889.1 anti-sigma factor [Anaerolineaceae bacterium]HOG80182.1 anti-sigma factor [Anaerolineaceae bacterium]